MNFSALFVLFLFVASSISVDVTIVDPEKSVDSQYIIVFHPSVNDQQRFDHLKTLHKDFAADNFDNRIINTWSIGEFKGFSAKLSASVLETQKSSPLIQLIEQDAIITIAQTCQEQSKATWGLDRVAERDLNLDGVFRYGVTGAGVDSYIVDTGIAINHKDFSGRAIWGVNYADNENTDCNGHGTHVAGTVGGDVYGVAKKTTLIAVKVLDCNGSGTNAGVISGVNWVVTSANSRKRPSVANMSLGGGKSTALDQAVAAAIAAGVTFSIAAGNSNMDACNTSPANVPTAITVGATGTDSTGATQVDNRAYFSNFGSCVSIFAPGLMITSSWIGGNDAIQTISGTSMAAPHVAGIVAAYLEAHPAATPAQVKSALVADASPNIIDLDCLTTACNRSPNLMVFAPCNP